MLLKKTAVDHPFLFSVGVLVADALIAVPFVIAFKGFDLDLTPLRLVIPIAQSVLMLWILHDLGWLKAAGFGRRIKDIEVLWFPLALAFLPFVLFGTIEIAAGPVAFYVLALVFTGLSEESMARGIILRTLLPKGLGIALLFMSALFSAAHFSNLVFEDFSALQMAEKLLVTFGFAMLYGAVFLRTLNIWPLIVLHAVHDFALLASGTAGPYTVQAFPAFGHVVIAVLSIGYAVYIVRGLDGADVLKQTQH